MSKNHGWRGRLPKFDAVHIDTPERFVGTMGNHRVSIALVDMGIWEVDVLAYGRYVVDELVTARNMDQAIEKALSLANIITKTP